MFTGIERRLTDRFHWEKSSQERRQVEEFPEHYFCQIMAGFGRAANNLSQTNSAERWSAASLARPW
jgi:hypothetical protein